MAAEERGENIRPPAGHLGKQTDRFREFHAVKCVLLSFNPFPTPGLAPGERIAHRRSDPSGGGAARGVVGVSRVLTTSRHQGVFTVQPISPHGPGCGRGTAACRALTVELCACTATLCGVQLPLSAAAEHIQLSRDITPGTSLGHVTHTRSAQPVATPFMIG